MVSIFIKHLILNIHHILAAQRPAPKSSLALFLSLSFLPLPLLSPSHSLLYPRCESRWMADELARPGTGTKGVDVKDTRDPFP